MKKIVSIFCLMFFFLFIFLLFNKTVSATGQYCCNTGFSYNPSDNTDLKPCKPPTTTPYVQPQEWYCYSEEVCVDTGVFSRSICSLNPSDGDPCCDSGFKYNSSQVNDPQPCKPPTHAPYVSPRAWKCSGNQQCSSKGYCITGEEGKNPSSQPISLLQPKECCLVEYTREYRGSELVDFCAEENKGIQTALGCFPTHPKAIVEWLLKYALMFSGAIGFLLMLYASFQIMTSSGDPDKLKAGQQLLTGAIVGILVIVFSVFILRYVGVTILQIPGWE